LNNWNVYIILCSDNSFYTGISTDIQRRFQDHFKQRGAKYFRGRKPEKIVYYESGHNRSTASQKEAQIKALSREKKCLLIQSDTNECKGNDISC